MSTYFFKSINSKFCHIAAKVLFVICSLFSSLAVNTANAQKNEKAVIQHVPIKSAQLPEPGMPMTLSFNLSDLSGVISKERLMVVRDGKLMDVTLVEGAVPGTDKLGHNAVINAPLVELKYWAVITLTNGNIISSPSYTLRRSCIPNIALSPVDDPENSSLQERIARYVQQSKDLERDLSQYEIAISLLESLVGQMKEGE
jgi:hypothetical protein